MSIKIICNDKNYWKQAEKSTSKENIWQKSILSILKKILFFPFNLFEVIHLIIFIIKLNYIQQNMKNEKKGENHE